VISATFALVSGNNKLLREIYVIRQKTYKFILLFMQPIGDGNTYAIIITTIISEQHTWKARKSKNYGKEPRWALHTYVEKQ
jgi:hypothetical protein